LFKLLHVIRIASFYWTKAALTFSTMHEQKDTIQLFAAAAKCLFLDMLLSGMSCLWNAWMYSNETCKSYSLTGPNDTGYISRLWV